MQAKAAIGRVDPESEQTRMLECDIITKIMWMTDLDERGVDREALIARLLTLASSNGESSGPQLLDAAKFKSLVALQGVAYWTANQESSWVSYTPMKGLEGISDLYTKWKEASTSSRRFQTITMPPEEEKKYYGVFAQTIGTAGAGKLLVYV